MDIKCAFLQGMNIDRLVYVVPPIEANTKRLWKLNTAVYGLVDASRTWYLKVKNELSSLGAKKSIYDNALFYWQHENVMQGFMCCHVDDFFCSGIELFHSNVIASLKKNFSLSKEITSSVVYTGINLIQKDNQVIMHQHDYISKIEPIPLYNLSESKSTASQIPLIRGLVGQLQLAPKLTRPDISFSSCDLSSRAKNATIVGLKRETRFYVN